MHYAAAIHSKVNIKKEDERQEGILPNRQENSRERPKAKGVPNMTYHKACKC